MGGRSQLRLRERQGYDSTGYNSRVPKPPAIVSPSATLADFTAGYVKAGNTDTVEMNIDGGAFTTMDTNPKTITQVVAAGTRTIGIRARNGFGVSATVTADVTAA